MSVDDQIAVKKVVKRSGSSFFWGMNILKLDQKRAMFSIYAFCRVVDDIADGSENKKNKIKSLENWRIKINDIFKLKKFNSSIERELKISVNKFKLKRHDFYSIIDGMLMDAEEDIKFPSIKKFNLYCDRVAVAVGYLSIRVFGLNNNEKKYAFYLGRAFQITNIVRDFYEDLNRGRCYIPSNHLSNYNIKKDIKTLINKPKLQNILQDMLTQANDYFNRADKEAGKINKKKIIASELMKAFYKKIHKKLFRKKINLKERIRLNFIEKFLIILIFLIRK